MDLRLDDLLRRAATIQRLRTERALADLGVTQGQFAVLAIIVANPAVPNADIARIEGLTPQTVSVIVANLVRRGVVLRTPHAVHGRIQQLEATAAGVELFGMCKERAEKLSRRLSGELTPDELRTVRRWLSAVAARG